MGIPIDSQSNSNLTKREQLDDNTNSPYTKQPESNSIEGRDVNSGDKKKQYRY
jgi:hypothetical protein